MIISTRNLPESIRRYRLLANLTQEQLAEEAEVNMHTISRIERGVTSPTTTTLEKIFAAIVNSQPLQTEKAQREIGGAVLLSFDNLT
jgi:transcriptional regulator with XRE-family HTH domain